MRQIMTTVTNIPTTIDVYSAGIAGCECIDKTNLINGHNHNLQNGDAFPIWRAVNNDKSMIGSMKMAE